MWFPSLINKLSLIVFTITFTFIFADLASAQVPFNKNGSVAGKGVINGTNSSATGIGVRGIVNSATGKTKGVNGITRSKSNGAAGLHGWASYGASDAGFTYGVLGQSNSPKGRGVYGIANSNTGATRGVMGWSKSPDGSGVYGKNTIPSGWAGYFDGKFEVKNIMRMIPSIKSPNIIGGYSGNSVNSVTTVIYGATIGGGGALSNVNKVTSSYGTVGGGKKNHAGAVAGSRFSHAHATVSGGFHNTASNYASTVGGGADNTASGNRSVVSGGSSNLASGKYGTVSGGQFNKAQGELSSVGGGWKNFVTGYAATIPGGRQNTANGDYSFAAGRKADTGFNSGVFIWGDSTNSHIIAPEANTFIVRAKGGVWFGKTSLPVIRASTFIDTSTTAFLSTTGVWTDASDRNLKEDFVDVNGKEILEKVATMPLNSWKYKIDDDSIRHIGPTAQDFYAAYGVGVDDKHIASLDTAGVALAAIQGLYDVVKEKEARIADLESRLLALENRPN